MHTYIHKYIYIYIHTLHTCCNEYCKIVKSSYLEQSKKCKACSITAVMELKINYIKNTYIQTYIHIYIHTCIHTCIHTHTRTYIHTYIHTYIQVAMNTVRLLNLVI